MLLIKACCLAEKRSRGEAEGGDGDVTMEDTSSVKKQKTTPLKSDDSIKLVKEVLAREREIMTRSSVLKGSKNFTHAINLARQLVLGKDVPPASRSGGTQKSGNYSEKGLIGEH